MSKPINQELPCPFCVGCKTEVCHDDVLAWTRCKSCGATGPALTKYSSEEGEPCTDWNTRAAVQPAGVAVPEGYVLMPVRCPSWLEDAYDAQCANDGLSGGLHLPAYDAMVSALAAPHPVSGDQKASASVSIGVDTLKWWRQLIDLNPADLAPRLDAALAAHRAQQGEQS